MSDTTKSADQLRAEIAKQGEFVKNLKTTKAAKDEIMVAVDLLKKLKLELNSLAPANNTFAAKFDRAKFEDTLKRKFFYIQSGEIYGGTAGLFDFGPPGAAIKQNVVSEWRNHFVLEEGMHEIECCTLTPDCILRASGHVERFADFMVQDSVTNEYFRADHVLEEFIDKFLADSKTTEEQRSAANIDKSRVDEFDITELEAKLTQYNAISAAGNSLSRPTPFNLMFATSIGPAGLVPAFLRPETAQGMFTNFRRLLEFNNGKLPFAACQIGTAYRNEISPRAGLLRVREFTMAEIEHFIKPHERDHPKFEEVADVKLSLLSRESQLSDQKINEITLREALEKGMISNSTLAYFMGRTHLFLMKCGINAKYLRFRQHLLNEMAHYSTDCWDAEIETSYGWVECVGHAERACYDLKAHMDKSKVDLDAFETYDKPRIENVTVVAPQKGPLGRNFRKEAKPLIAALEAADTETALKIREGLAKDGKYMFNVEGTDFEIAPEHVKIKDVEKKVNGFRFLPHVIEPSFGIGRIMYALLEHSFSIRKGDEQRVVLGLSPVMAPTKIVILPLSANKEFVPMTSKLSTMLRRAGLTAKIDDCGQSIGRRYSRNDEVGTPLAVTVDFDTMGETDLKDTVTVRERDSQQQIRVHIDELVNICRDIVSMETTWEEITKSHTLLETKE